MFSNISATLNERLFWSPGIRNAGYFFCWFTLSVFLLGLFALWSEQSYILPFFFAAGYSAVLFAFVRTVRVWRDPFNPLCLVLVIGFVRFSCPGLFLLIGAEPPGEVGLLFELMKLSDRD